MVKTNESKRKEKRKLEKEEVMMGYSLVSPRPALLGSRRSRRDLFYITSFLSKLDHDDRKNDKKEEKEKKQGDDSVCFIH
ncbi:hypothetical protein RRG08_003494 [Elysia crispata]|uniref:Uncharacterized protein n=1 Tax=Elysia crispata TaxID=231223 RepID=A0AAE1CTZ0_9GAST|nr:hypothetical protein RRG08_003494 [Elysia crispata]